MTKSLHQDHSHNRVLLHLSALDFGLLAPSLTAVDLPVRMQLECPDKLIEYAYFIESGFASVVANGAGSGGVEVGIIGLEGLTGMALIMATDRSPNATYIQSPGSGQRISAGDLKKSMETSPSLRRSLLHYAHTFLVQMAYTALANGRSKLETRLARWLLMAHDRAGGDQLILTHEFLATMLGVRRPGVTVALSFLERRGLVRVQRKSIIVVDRQGLEEAANHAYGVPEAEFRRLFG
jgi:CRP-like cAMP-binding protein